MNSNNSYYASSCYHSGGCLGNATSGYTLGNGTASSFYPLSGNVIATSSNVSYATSWGIGGNSYAPKRTSVDIFKDILKKTVENHDKKEKEGIFTKSIKEALRRKDEGTKSKKELIKELKQYT